MNTRLLFTVVTARASAAEQRQLLEGIISQAFEMNIDISVVSNIYNASEYNPFITNENTVYNLIENSRHDGIIFTDDSFMNHELREKVCQMINESGEPVISTGSAGKEYESVCSSTSGDIEKMTDHMTEVHGFTDFDFLTGFENSPQSAERIEGFRRSLEKHGIQFDSSRVIYGDFWEHSGKKLAMEYIERKRKLPQAVICANDYMAYALTDTLTAHGIKIPEDVSVSGYEYIGDRTDHYPVLTTFSRNRKNIGRNAVISLYRMVTGTDNVYEHVNTNGTLIPGNTCPCGVCSEQISHEISEKKKQQYYTSLNDTGMLEQFLTKTVTVPDFISALNRHSYIIPDLSGLYLCLYDDWCVNRSTPYKKESENGDTVCYAISDIYREYTPPLHFRRNSLFPEELISPDHPNAYYCCPVFFMDEDFGYMIVRYGRVQCFGESFRSWNKIAANALEFLQMKNDIDYLVRCQNLSQYRDSATGLYNAEGFLNESDISLRNTSSEEFTILAVNIHSGKNTFAGTDNYDNSNTVISEISGITDRFSSANGFVCGMSDRNTFVIFSSESFSDNTLEILKTEISIFFRNIGIYGDDICSAAAVTGRTSDGNLKAVMEEATELARRKNIQKAEKYSLPDYQKFAKLRSRLYFSPEKNITAEDACREFCLSSGYFRVMYKKFFGVSFHQDCIAMKIELAKLCLVSTMMNIASVSEKCGFQNEKYLMRQFKTVTGCTPNQYRKMFGK